MRRRTARLVRVLSSVLFAHQVTEQELDLAAERSGTAAVRPPLLERPAAVIWLVLLALPIYVLLALIVPPFDDEYYYWCWSEDLQLSYFDHPGMVAYFIRLATAVFGHSVLAIRVPSIVSGLVVLGVVARLSRPRNLIPYIFLSPVPMFAMVMITPDVPLLMFWALYLLWMVKLHERLALAPAGGPAPSLGYWALGGLILGCGVLSKYTMGLAAVFGSVSFLFAGNWRRWLPGYVLHALVSIAAASPIFFFNLQHDFVPLRFQWEHVMESAEPGLFPLLEFVGVELLLFGSVPFITFGWGLWHGRSLAADPRLRACACLYLLPFGYFLYKSTRGHLEANWPFACYIACWPLAAQLYGRVREWRGRRYLTAMAFALPLGATTFILIHAIHPIPFFPVENDRATRQWDKMRVMRTIAADLRDAGYHGRVYTTTYQLVSVLRWHGMDAEQQDALTRPSHFTERPHRPADPSHRLFFLETSTPTFDPAVFPYGKFRIWKSYPVFVRGELFCYYLILDQSNPPVLPGTVEGGSTKPKK